MTRRSSSATAVVTPGRRERPFGSRGIGGQTRPVLPLAELEDSLEVAGGEASDPHRVGEVEAGRTPRWGGVGWIAPRWEADTRPPARPPGGVTMLEGLRVRTRPSRRVWLGLDASVVAAGSLAGNGVAATPREGERRRRVEERRGGRGRFGSRAAPETPRTVGPAVQSAPALLARCDSALTHLSAPSLGSVSRGRARARSNPSARRPA